MRPDDAPLREPPEGRWSAPRLPPRADVQGLRALAVGVVVLDHVGVGLLEGGFVGVDVFFVVSGFLITTLLLRELVEDGRVRIGAFYARRARRILPAATVVLAAVVVASTLLLPLTRAVRVGVDVVWASLFVGNVRLAREGTDYFTADLPPSPVQHFWSLAVEEQFYVVWPAALAVLAAGAVWRSRRRDGRPRAAGQARVADRVLGPVSVLVVLAWVASFAWSVLLTRAEPSAAYFSTPARAWELATGALLALAAARGLRLPARGRALVATSGLAAITAAALAYGPGTPFPGWQAAVPVLGTAAVLAAGDAGRAHGAARLLTWRPATWLGDISYSLYLWHWPVVLLAPAVLARTSVAPVPAVVRLLLVVVVSMLLAVASYHLVEAPFRRAARPWSTTRRSLVLWPAAVALVLATVGWSGSYRDGQLEQRADAAASFDASAVPRDLRTARTGEDVHDAIAVALDRAAVGGPVPFPVRNGLTNLDQDKPDYPSRCFAQGDAENSELCPVGDVGAGARVVLLGDSHAQMWLPGLDEAGQRGGFEVVPLVKFGCPPSDLRLRELDQPGDPEFTACYAWRTWALEQLTALSPDTVVVISRTPPPGIVLDPGVTEGEAWRTALEDLATTLQPLAGRVVLGGDVSYLRRDPAQCVGRADATMAECTVDADSTTARFNRLTRAAAASAGADFADLDSLVCARGRCPMVVDDVVTYHDAQHVSATWASEVASRLSDLLGLGPDGSAPNRVSPPPGG